MRRVFVAGLLLGVLLASPRAACASEVVEPWEDGTTPHKRYFVDEKGRKQGRSLEYAHDGKTVTLDASYRDDALDGAYLEFREDGKPKVRTTYRAGKVHGKHEEFGAQGDLVESSTYVDGALDGRRQVFREKKPVATQTWRLGSLVTLDGTPAFPRGKDEMTKTVAAILAGDLPKASEAPKPKHAPRAKASPRAAASDSSAIEQAVLASAPKDLAEQREIALRRLRAYRYLCGVPWEDLVAGPAESLTAQCASHVCSRLGRITHTPSNPGLDPALFQACADGAASCNLHLGHGMHAAGAMDGWIDDSDPSNIGRVGHRRWALSLDLKTTGFGIAVGAEDVFWSMYTMDHGRAQPPDVPYVVFPPRGFMPSEMFGAHYAWSVSMDPALEMKATIENASIRVRRLSADFVPEAEDLTIEARAFHGEQIGGRSALIFRPKGLAVADGAAYVAELSLTDPKTHKPTVVLRWVTAFVGEPRPPDEWGAPPSEDRGGDEGGK